MKKAFLTAAVVLLTAAALAGCGAKKDSKTLTVGATPAPHAEILEVAKEVMAEKGYTLEIKVYNDYVQPNTAVENGDLDANYFQHVLYLEQFNEEQNTHLAIAEKIHYEPFGIYGGKTKSLDAIPDGGTVAVPNDTTNEARALLLLEQQGLIKLQEGVGLNATKKDIIENPKNLDIKEVEAAQIPLSLQDVDVAVINGNYAIGAGLSVGKDALAIEDAESDVVQQNYANVIAVKEGNENNEAIKALIEALKSDKVKDFINEKYDGAVVPLF
ncbi:MAG: MetQ/NlpA family ABC transporter substrate-binding protein [bacterium]|nr:MetQ/NlpA family ABC transporter substrate-binding protein [bacterium]